MHRRSTWLSPIASHTWLPKALITCWLARKRSDSDRRSNRLVLSGEGEELLDRIERAQLFSASSLGDPFDILDSAERAAFFRSLEKVESRARDRFGAQHHTQAARR